MLVRVKKSVHSMFQVRKKYKISTGKVQITIVIKKKFPYFTKSTDSCSPDHRTFAILLLYYKRTTYRTILA